MLDKKKNQVIFLFEFRICHKATVTSTMHLSQEYTVQRWFKTFCKVEKSLKDEGCSGQLSEVDNNQLRRPLKVLKPSWEVAEELYIKHYILIEHLKEIGKMKKFDKWLPHVVVVESDSLWP